ncbi:MAG: JAB domain-containing protein [Gemmatimonadota bacterium]
MLRATQVMEARIVREEPVGRIETPRDVYALARTLGADKWPEERFVVLCLDTRNNVRHVQEVTRGILDASVVHPREIFWLAVHERAAAVILLHNHPSGDPTPSAADRAVTRHMIEAGSGARHSGA